MYVNYEPHNDFCQSSSRLTLSYTLNNAYIDYHLTFYKMDIMLLLVSKPNNLILNLTLINQPNPILVKNDCLKTNFHR